MWALWGIAAVPAAAWALFWAGSKKITKAEALIASAAGIVCCLIFQVIAVMGMTADTETWSGKVTSLRYDTPYVQWYMQRRTRTKHHWVNHSSGTGKNRKTWRSYDAYEEVYYTRETRRVGPEWSCSETLSGSHSISKSQYEHYEPLFGGAQKHTGMKDNYDSGDPYTYVAPLKTDCVWPTVDTRIWENRVKACPSLFTFAEVPEGTAGVYEYPRNPNWDRSGRLLGTAAQAVDILTWDQMNARLGPTKWVNVIAIGFGDRDSSIAHTQQAKWVGGKQNDLVLCYGGPNEKPTWTMVFGWSEREVAKRDLETILLDGFTPATLPKIEQEIQANYVIKDFSKFDYLTVEPPAWAYAVLLGVIVGTQLVMALFFFKNEFTKDGEPVRRYRYGSY